MSDDIRPALTAEQWEQAASGDVQPSAELLGIGPPGYEPPEVFVGDDAHDVQVSGDMRRALGALYLYGQPGGVTADDVRTLRELAGMARLFKNTHADTLAAGAESVAARLAALLPPAAAHSGRAFGVGSADTGTR